MNSKIINQLGLEMGTAWSSCPVMPKDARYSGQKLLEQKTRRLSFLCIIKASKMLHSNQDFPHYPDIPLSDFLCTKSMSGSQNVPPFSLTTVFPQAQPDMSKRKTYFLQLLSLVTQLNKEDVLPTTSWRRAKALHSLQTSASSILHESWFVGQISFSHRKRNLVTLFYCPYQDTFWI